MASNTGATVSRRLRAAGFNVSPSARRHRFNGLFVSGRGSRVTITIDLGVPSENDRVACELLDAVDGWPQVSYRDISWSIMDDGAILMWIPYSAS
jgi:hypothetical protein